MVRSPAATSARDAGKASLSSSLVIAPADDPIACCAAWLLP